LLVSFYILNTSYYSGSRRLMLSPSTEGSPNILLMMLPCRNMPVVAAWPVTVVFVSKTYHRCNKPWSFGSKATNVWWVITLLQKPAK